MTGELAGFIDAERTDRGVAHIVLLRALNAVSSTFYKHLNRQVTPIVVPLSGNRWVSVRSVYPI